MFPETGTLNNYEITIQLSLDGFSFVTYNIDNHIYTDLETFNEPGISLKAALSEVQSRFCCDIDEFAKVNIIFDNCANTFVPASIFQNQAKAKYLDFLGAKKEDSNAVADFLGTIEADNIFSITKEDTDALAEIHTETRFHHASSILVASIIKDNTHRNNEPAIYLNIKSNRFDMIVTKGCNLLFHNVFSFKTKEDFLYFLLFTADQLHLDTGSVPLFFLGHVEEKSQLVELTARYIRDIRFVRRNNNMSFTEKVEETPYYYNYTLYNSTSCEL